MPTAQLLPIVIGISTFGGVVGLVAYLYFAQNFQRAEESIRGIVEGNALFNAKQIVEILAQFKDDDKRLVALVALTKYSNDKAEKLLQKAKSNVDVEKLSITWGNHYQQRAKLAAVFFFLLASIALVYYVLTAPPPPQNRPPEKPVTVPANQSSLPVQTPKPGSSLRTASQGRASTSKRTQDKTDSKQVTPKVVQHSDFIGTWTGTFTFKSGPKQGETRATTYKILNTTDFVIVIDPAEEKQLSFEQRFDLESQSLILSRIHSHNKTQVALYIGPGKRLEGTATGHVSGKRFTAEVSLTR